MSSLLEYFSKRVQYIFDFYQRYKQMSEKSKVYFDISQRMQCILEIVSKIINFYIKHTTQIVPNHHFKHHATPPGKHLMPQQPTFLKK